MFNKIKQALSLGLGQNKWHVTSANDTVFTKEKTAAGHKVWFELAIVETHEETGDKRVKIRNRVGPRFFDENSWDLATALSDRQNTYSKIISLGKYKAAYPKDEYIDEIVS